MSHPLPAFALLGLAMILAGSTLAASKLIGQSLSPLLASAIRFAVALPILYGLMRHQGLHWPRPSRRDGALLLLQAACGSIGYTLLLILGLRYTPIGDAAVIAGTLPAVSALVAVLITGSLPGRRVGLAILLATAGTCLLQWQPAGETAPWRWLGNGLILGAIVCEAVFILLQRKLSQPIAPLTLATSLCALGLLLSLPAALWQAATLPAIPWPALLACLYYGVLPTALGFWLWYAGSAAAPPQQAALATALMPLSAAGFGLLLGERLGAGQMAGMLAVLLAMWLAAGRQPPTSPNEPRPLETERP